MSVSAAAPEYAVEEIIARLNEWQKKIVTLRITTQEEFDPQSKMAKDAHLQGVERVGHFDWIWTDTGAIRQHRWFTHNAIVEGRALRVDGAPRQWSAKYGAGPSDERKPRKVSIETASASTAPGSIAVTPLFGLWMPGLNSGWLGERIQRGGFELGKMTELDGRACIVIHHLDGRHSEDFWLDPNRGFMPLQIENRDYFKQSVEEFFEPEPGFFVPRRGTFVHRQMGAVIDTKKWEVLSVELNQAIPSELWEPPVADGTEVTDLTTGKSYVQGGRSHKPEIVAGIADAAEKNLPGSPAVARQGSDTDVWWSAGFVLLAIALLGSALFVWRSGR